MAEETKTPSRPKRVKLTLSMTESDRAALEAMAYAEGLTMAGLVHQWIQRELRRGGR